MRKIFSLSLIAVALLISGQVKAAENVAKIGTTEYATLQEAVDSVKRAQADPTTIELLQEISLNKAVCVFDRNITINMNGKSISGNNEKTAKDYEKVAFALISGTLRLSGTGSVLASDSLGEGVRMFGSANPQAENYSNLIVDKNVTIFGQKGIQIYTWGGGYLNKSENTWPSIIDFEDGINGNKPRTTDTENDVDQWFAGLSETERADLKLASNKLQSYCLDNGHYGFAFGVTISVDGTLQGREYAIQTSGVLRSTPSTKEVFKNATYPVITINEGATVQGQSNGGVKYAGSYPTGIYAAGYAYWKVYGNVSGDNGIVAKSGNITVEGNAIVSASGVFYGSTSSTVSGSGTKGSGSAIDVVSDNSYSGGTTITVGGSSTITSVNGYAILEEEAVGSTTDNKTNSITVTGGTFETKADDKAAIYTTPTIQNKIVTGGTITGGTYSDQSIQDYLPTTGVINQVENDKGETVYTISSKPAEKEWQNADINTVADGSYVQYKAQDADVAYTLTKDVNIDYLSMTSVNQGTVLPDYKQVKVTIPTGKTLKVGEIVMDAHAQIVVEAGGKLVVNSNNGIVAFSDSNLVIKADAENGMGMFLLNPQVAANKSPRATVEYVTSAKCGKEEIPIREQTVTEYHWDILSSPFATIDTLYSTTATYYNRIVDGTFVPCKRKDIMDNTKAFELIAICPDVAPAATKYTFTGKLQGANDLSDSKVVAKFNYMGNAYMGKMNVKEMVQELQQSESAVHSLIYLWDMENMKWVAKTGYDLETLGDVNPLTAIVLYSDAEGKVNLNYENLIWKTNK